MTNITWIAAIAAASIVAVSIVGINFAEENIRLKSLVLVEGFKVCLSQPDRSAKNLCILEVEKAARLFGRSRPH